jgi:hypothetical protein
VNDGHIVVAVDDSADPQENLFVRRPGRDWNDSLFNSYNQYLLERKNSKVDAAIERAMSSGRVYRAPSKSPTELTLFGAYSGDPMVRAILPHTAEPYEQHLRKYHRVTGCRYVEGCVQDLTARECIKSGVNENTVLVRFVGIGYHCLGFSHDNYLVADATIDCSGDVRLVRERTTGDG